MFGGIFIYYRKDVMPTTKEITVPSWNEILTDSYILVDKPLYVSRAMKE